MNFQLGNIILSNLLKEYIDFDDTRLNCEEFAGIMRNFGPSCHGHS
jgi:hypothetical protein